MKIDDASFVKYMIWSLTHDEEWLEQFADTLDPDIFDDRALNFIVSLAKVFWEEYGEPCPFEEWAELAIEEYGNELGLEVEDILGLYDECKEPPESLRKALFGYTRDWLRRRGLSLVNNEVAVLLDEGKVDAAIQLLNEHLEDSAVQIDAPEAKNIFDLEELDTRLDTIAKELSLDWDSTAIQTEIPTIDTVMRGGIRPTEFGIILAPTNRGKSQLLIALACAAFKQNKRVLFISLEMSQTRVEQRAFANFTGLTFDDVVNDPRGTQRRIKEELKKRKLDKASLDAVSFPADAVTVADLMSYVNKSHKEADPYDIIIIDYADRIKPAKEHRGNRVDEQKEVYTSLQSSAFAFNVPIWTASQGNRESLNKANVGIEHIANSYDKATVADWIIAMDQTKDEKTNNVMRLQMIKARNAELEMSWVETDFARARLMEIERPGLRRAG